MGLIFTADSFTRVRAKMIAETLNRPRLPSISPDASYIPHGTLMTYSSDALEQYRLAPLYIDRLLKGAKAVDLPVHLPTRYKLTVNRKTAAALGIDVPLGLLLAADEVIE